MAFWVLVASYWLHLLATVVWLGGMALFVFVAWPALRQETLNHNQWLTLQKRFLPWGNGSLVLLLLTGFVQMTNDPNYDGFLAINSLWAGAILVKHLAFVGMVLVAAYLQLSVYPAMDRVNLLVQKRPQLAETEYMSLHRQEMRLLRLNLVCAVVVLLCTAVATAV